MYGRGRAETASLGLPRSAELERIGGYIEKWWGRRDLNPGPPALWRPPVGAAGFVPRLASYQARRRPRFWLRVVGLCGVVAGFIWAAVGGVWPVLAGSWLGSSPGVPGFLARCVAIVWLGAF